MFSAGCNPNKLFAREMPRAHGEVPCLHSGARMVCKHIGLAKGKSGCDETTLILLEIDNGLCHTFRKKNEIKDITRLR